MVEVKVPRLAESISEAVLAQWLKQDGEQVKTDEPIATLETDKAAVELPADTSGVLRHARKVGETVSVGDVIARIEAATPAEPAAQPAVTAEPKVEMKAQAKAPAPAKPTAAPGAKPIAPPTPPAAPPMPPPAPK